MKVILDETIDEVYLKRFNISPDKVIHSLENPDSKKIIKLQDYKVIDVLKKFDNYYLLIDGRSQTGDEVKIDKENNVILVNTSEHTVTKRNLKS